MNTNPISGGILLISLITAALTVDHPLITLSCLVIAGIAAYQAGRSNMPGRKPKP
jgi:hypothetical protein